MQLAKSALIGVWLAVMGSANAQMISGYADDVRRFDPRELALLPSFCTYTQDFRERVPGGSNQTKQAHWQGVLGPAFNHLHHYCYGLMKANRGLLLARTTQAKKFFLEEALSEYDYVIDRAPIDFVLLPEIHARKGQVQLRRGFVHAGIDAIEESISLKPDYWLPYAFASDHYRSAGDIERARHWLERGLKAAPGTPSLESRVAALEAAHRGDGPRPR